ncbi:DUF4136 domain-containing protein [Rhodoferax sp.]|uniref:DUF4136 domain-containing protein n=1 Tax=Rhodoferax sp. TaxID=50421 RepID=UPI0025E0453D|nr:DUF4136 domain-containing protein [Rhodoferax sp.]
MMTGWRALTLTAAVLLVGCASVTRVDNDVQSFTNWTSAVPRPLGFRFERLPSQQTDAATQDAVEQLSLPALAQAGLVQDTANARYSLQISTQLLTESTWSSRPYGPWGRGGPWMGGGRGMRGPFMAPMMPMLPMEVRTYQRLLSLVLRDLATGQVVYETQASQDSNGPIGSDQIPAMVTAALHGFPNPPAGLQRITVDIPPTPQ